MTTRDFPTSEPKRRRLWFKVLMLVCAAGVSFAGWLFLERKRGRAALKQYEQELIAKGERLTFAELLTPVPEGENGAVEFAALTFRTGVVFVLNSPPNIKCVAPGKALVITKETEWFYSDGDRFTWAQARSDLERNADVLNELRAIVRSPVLRHPIRYQGTFMRLPLLAGQKAAAQWLSGSALLRIHTEDIDGAIKDIESIMLLTRLGKDEPLPIPQLVSLALVQIAVNPCWPLLQSHLARDEQLALLQAVFSSADLVSPMVAALEGERARGRDIFKELRRDVISMNQMTGGGQWLEDDEAPRALDNIPYNEEMKGAIRTAIVYPLWGYAFSHGDERRFLAETQALIDAVRSSKQRRSATHVRVAGEAFELRAKRDGELGSWRHLGTKMLVLGDKATSRAFRAQTHCGIAVAAIALRRYHMRHNEYPRSLDELVPEFVREVPIDWMDGKPLRYRRDGDQFVLWSVGPDGKDDGGTPNSRPKFHWMLGPDDVWPQPASDAEMAAYRESQTKR